MWQRIIASMASNVTHRGQVKKAGSPLRPPAFSIRTNNSIYGTFTIATSL